MRLPINTMLCLNRLTVLSPANDDFETANTIMITTGVLAG